MNSEVNLGIMNIAYHVAEDVFGQGNSSINFTNNSITFPRGVESPTIIVKPILSSLIVRDPEVLDLAKSFAENYGSQEFCLHPWGMAVLREY